MNRNRNIVLNEAPRAANLFTSKCNSCLDLYLRLISPSIKKLSELT
jgi:hypothetical protein